MQYICKIDSLCTKYFQDFLCVGKNYYCVRTFNSFCGHSLVIYLFKCPFIHFEYLLVPELKVPGGQLEPQGDTLDNQFITDLHRQIKPLEFTHTYRQLRVLHSCFWTVGGNLKEAGEPGEKPRSHRENTQTPHSRLQVKAKCCFILTGYFGQFTVFSSLPISLFFVFFLVMFFL